LVLWRAGVFEKFWFWTIDYARQYASIVPITESPRFFRAGAGRVIAANYSLWLIAASGLALIWLIKECKKIASGFWFQPGLGLERLPRFYFRNITFF